MEDKVFTFVEQKPEFPGGEKALMQYLADHIKYPAMARESNVEGKVFLSFVVGKDGRISDVKVLRGIGSGCDDEAKSVVASMPAWAPGKQNGQSVKVQYTLPVQFKLD
jgi:periplasmic protein TonB